MKLVRLSTVNGRVVNLALEYITSLQENGENTVVAMLDGERHMIAMEMQELENELQSAFYSVTVPPNVFDDTSDSPEQVKTKPKKPKPKKATVKEEPKEEPGSETERFPGPVTAGREEPEYKPARPDAMGAEQAETPQAETQKIQTG